MAKQFALRPIVCHIAQYRISIISWAGSCLQLPVDRVIGVGNDGLESLRSLGGDALNLLGNVGLGLLGSLIFLGLLLLLLLLLFYLDDVLGVGGFDAGDTNELGLEDWRMLALH